MCVNIRNICIIERNTRIIINARINMHMRMCACAYARTVFNKKKISEGETNV